MHINIPRSLYKTIISLIIAHYRRYQTLMDFACATIRCFFFFSLVRTFLRVLLRISHFVDGTKYIIKIWCNCDTLNKSLNHIAFINCQHRLIFYDSYLGAMILTISFSIFSLFSSRTWQTNR